MNRTHCRPAAVTAAFLLAFPMALSAQTAPPATPPDASATTMGPSSTLDTHHANPGVPAAAAAFDGQRAAPMDKQGSASVAKADRDFMHKAAGAGMYEVEV